MKEKKKEIGTEQKIYAALLVIGLIALASLTLLYGRKTKKMNDMVEQNIELDDESPVSGQVASTEEESGQTAAQENRTEETKEETQTANQEASQETAKIQNRSYNGKDKLIWPVSGNVLIPYSMDTTVYFETLDQYQCNPGLYLKAEKGTEVKAVYGGTVTKVTKDDRLGQMITVDMGNGYEMTYGQLENISCKKGEVIQTGSVIGKVAEPTNYFMLEGSHLYVKMTKDKKPVNPTDYFES